MKFSRDPLMGGYVAVKLPLLIALTLGCNGLLNGLLSLLLGTDPEYWLNLQQMHDVAAARGKQRGGYSFPSQTMVPRYSAPSRCREHVTPVCQAKGAQAGLKNDLQPVAATTRTRLHLPSRKLTSRKVQNQPGQIESSDLASTLMAKFGLQKKSKNTLVRSDITDPLDRDPRR